MPQFPQFANILITFKIIKAKSNTAEGARALGGAQPIKAPSGRVINLNMSQHIYQNFRTHLAFVFNNGLFYQSVLICND